MLPIQLPYVSNFVQYSQNNSYNCTDLYFNSINFLDTKRKLNKRVTLAIYVMQLYYLNLSFALLLKGVVVVFELLVDNFKGHIRTKQGQLPP